MNLEHFLAPIARLDALTTELRAEGEDADGFYITRPHAGLTLYGNAFMLVDVTGREAPDFAKSARQQSGAESDGGAIVWWGHLSRTKAPKVMRLWDAMTAAPAGVPVRWADVSRAIEDDGAELLCAALRTRDGKRECLIQTRFLRAVVRTLPALASYGCRLDMQDAGTPLWGVLRIRYRGKPVACVRGLGRLDDTIFVDAIEEGGAR